jgi:hypothetical protein
MGVRGDRSARPLLNLEHAAPLTIRKLEQLKDAPHVLHRAYAPVLQRREGDVFSVRELARGGVLVC